MLIVVKRLAYEKPYEYAPEREDCLINPEEVQSAIRTEARGSGPFLLIRLRGEQGPAREITIASTLEQFHKACNQASQANAKEEG